MSETITTRQTTDDQQLEPSKPDAPPNEPNDNCEKRRDGRPSQRERAIYERHVLRGETQEAIAADQQCSRQRVSQICQKVERFVATHPDDELAAALRVRCQRRFDAVYLDAVRQFERSKQDLVTERERTSHRVPDDQPEKGVTTTVREHVRRQQNGDPRLLNAALRAVERMERMVGSENGTARESDKAKGPGGRPGEGATGRQGEAAQAKPWWVKNYPRGSPKPPVCSESVPPAPPPPVAASRDATGQGDRPQGEGAIGRQGEEAIARQGEEAIRRESEQVSATATSGTAEVSVVASVTPPTPHSAHRIPHSSPTPHSALRTPYSSSTPHSATAEQSIRAPEVASARRATPPPLRDTVLIVGAPRQVPEIERFAREKLRGYQVVTRTSLVHVVEWLKEDLGSTALISLDDDMGGRRVELGEMLDPGTMVEVATAITKCKPCCPVVLNMAQEQARDLMKVLMSARWLTYWAKPTGGHWLRQDWLSAVRRALRDGRPRRPRRSAAVQRGGGKL
ncbi:MAG TPA: hypothetical protein VJ783_13755 [Pirellulales bacterium]|nr:hypothetical protein [Pirellulales bacterium]